MSIPGNTKRATETWVRAFSEYGSDLNLKTCAASELAPKLEGFYADLRKQDGSVYKRASYIATRGALQRHLTCPLIFVPFFQKKVTSISGQI